MSKVRKTEREQINSVEDVRKTLCEQLALLAERSEKCDPLALPELTMAMVVIVDCLEKLGFPEPDSGNGTTYDEWKAKRIESIQENASEIKSY